MQPKIEDLREVMLTVVRTVGRRSLSPGMKMKQMVQERRPILKIRIAESKVDIFLSKEMD